MSFTATKMFEGTVVLQTKQGDTSQLFLSNFRLSVATV